MKMPVHIETGVHLAAAALAATLLALFLGAALTVALFGSDDAIARVRHFIVAPGLYLLVPALAVAGISGFLLSRTRRGGRILARKLRMPFIATNAILVLVPCAILLDAWAAIGAFVPRFYLVQAIELAVGAANFALIALSVRDALRSSGRLTPQKESAT
jgi:hypothetical protein